MQSAKQGKPGYIRNEGSEDMGEIRLQNVKKLLYFKPSLLNAEMHEVGSWPENVGDKKILVDRLDM